MEVVIVQLGLCPFFRYFENLLLIVGSPTLAKGARLEGLVRAPLETPQPFDIEKHNPIYQTKLDVKDGTSCTGFN